MIKFTRVFYKNFMSVGEHGIEIPLDKTSETLIIGKNGCGKSTFLESVAFALFDKPFRKISKNKLVNSVNGKKCLVELDFQKGKDVYKIVRGIKPNKFEIYKNGELIEKEGNSRDYQEKLEKEILNMNYKSFTQVVMLGSALFVPFMELTAQDRRIIVEDLLDIDVLSKMSQIAKIELKTLNQNKMELETEYSSKKNTTQLKYDHYKSLLEIDKNRKTEIDGKIKEKEDKKRVLLKQNEELEKKIGQLETKITSLSDLQEKDRKISSKLQHNRIKLNDKKKHVDFYQSNDECPTCKQEIDKDYKQNIINEAEKVIQDKQQEIEKLEEMQSKVEEILQKIQVVVDKISELKRKEDTIKLEIKIIDTDIEKLKEEKEQENEQTKIVELKAEIKLLKQEIKDINQKIEDITVKIEEHQYAVELLKDSGIKAGIIQQYLPLMNKYINEYLEAMGFAVSFEIDNEFNETIRSRYRDEFTYANFSEGEKQRINLALLLTWRKIAQMRNSVATNLLILDEVFDSSLDEEGIEGFMGIMKTFDGNSNVFVISHRGDAFFERFNNVIEFEKIGNFTEMKQAR